MEIILIILSIVILFVVIRWAIDLSHNTSLLKQQLKELQEIKELLKEMKRQ